MIKSLGKHAVTVLAIGGLGAMAAGTPAQASGFSAAYTCNISNVGQVPATLNGWLSSPGTAFSGPSRFRLHISSLNLQSPIPIDSWNANAWINVGGAEQTTFQVGGAGGFVAPQGALAGDLVGTWAPVVGGTDLLSVGGLEITANTEGAGTVQVQCVPASGTVAEVLRVSSPYLGRWNRPSVPIFHIGGWYHPGMVLHRPVWNHPGGWNRPGRPGGWNRPGEPNRPGGWNRPGEPNHPGGWNRPGEPNHPGGWNRPGEPSHPVARRTTTTVRRTTTTVRRTTTTVRRTTTASRTPYGGGRDRARPRTRMTTGPGGPHTFHGFPPPIRRPAVP